MLLTSGTTVILADMLPILGKDASWKITICHWVTWFRPGEISLLPITSYLFLFFYIFCSIDFCARVYLSIQFYYLTFSSIIYWTVVCFPILFLSIINSLWSRLWSILIRREIEISNIVRVSRIRGSEWYRIMLKKTQNT